MSKLLMSVCSLAILGSPACNGAGGSSDAGDPEDAGIPVSSGVMPMDGGPAADAGVAQDGGYLGTVTGIPLTVQSSVIIDDDPDGGPVQAEIYLANTPGICTPDFGSGAGLYAPGMTFLDLQVLEYGGTGLVTPTAGTYTIVPNGGTAPSPQVAQAFFQHEDATCAPVAGTGGWATSGTLTITAIDLNPGGTTTGSLDIFFGTDELMGPFVAESCNAGMPRHIVCE